MEIAKPHIVLIASPGMGHLIPLLELSKRIVSLNKHHVTLFVVSTSTSTSQSHLLKCSSKFHQDLQFVELTPVNIPDIVSTNLSVESRLDLIMKESLATFKLHIASMESPPAALIVDIFGLYAFHVAEKLSIPKYVFVTSSAWFAALTIYVPTLDQEIKGQYIELTEPIQIPGCKPIRPSDVVGPMLDRDIERYRMYVNMGQRMRTADGILLNTWEDLEPQSVMALRENHNLRRIMKAHIYPVGPIIRSIGPDKIHNECLDWLMGQPNDSVLYVSFGSGGTLSFEQITEVAWGLELSLQRFIWVVRPPTMSDDASGSFFNTQRESDDPFGYLPQGFLTRIRGFGMLVHDWAPQVDILSHPSLGGFLSHCGWNSILESITNGVPMIAWPLYAEQRMNATLLAEVLGVAVQPELLPSAKIIQREEIAKMVRHVMVHNEGKLLRVRVRNIKKESFEAIDTRGSSYNSLLEVSKKWEANTKQV
ncbi:hypothetical protein ACHQM5_023217 [Ranunculus cassubicifolius]